MKQPIPFEQAVAMVPDETAAMASGLMSLANSMQLTEELLRQRRKTLGMVLK